MVTDGPKPVLEPRSLQSSPRGPKALWRRAWATHMTDFHRVGTGYGLHRCSQQPCAGATPCVCADGPTSACVQACGLKFKEKDNTDLACKFHPGPPVFHDRKKVSVTRAQRVLSGA